jgi:outer membrane protein assembly factor BamD
MAVYSVEEKKTDRYRETVDEYYAFKNEFPESEYMKEANSIFEASNKIIKD